MHGVNMLYNYFKTIGNSFNSSARINSSISITLNNFFIISSIVVLTLGFLSLLSYYSNRKIKPSRRTQDILRTVKTVIKIKQLINAEQYYKQIKMIEQRSFIYRKFRPGTCPDGVLEASEGPTI